MRSLFRKGGSIPLPGTLSSSAAHPCRPSSPRAAGRRRTPLEPTPLALGYQACCNTSGRGTGIDVRAGEPRIRRDENAQESSHIADGVHFSDLCLGFESAPSREDNSGDDMKAVLENVEECAGIFAMLEWLLGLTGRANVVCNDREEGAEIDRDAEESLDISRRR